MNNLILDKTPVLPDLPVTQERYDAVCAERARLSEENDRLRAALKPFASFWNDHSYKPNPEWGMDCCSSHILPTLGDCQRAAQALDGKS